MFESEDVNKASQLFKIMVYGIIGDMSSQKEEASNIGIAPQTINNWLINYNYEMPAFVLPRMRCGNVILSKLMAEWQERYGGSVNVKENISEIEMVVIEHIGIINNIIKNNLTQSGKHEAIDRMQKLKTEIDKMEIELHKILGE